MKKHTTLDFQLRGGGNNTLHKGFSLIDKFSTHFSKGFKPFPQFSKCAFTLAEVLITLGIISVVAAMMLPTLIQTYKVKLLEVQFKKADSIIQQALTKSVQEFGYDSITDFNFCVRLPEAEKAEKLAETQALMSEFNKIWLNQFKDPRPLDKMALSVHLMTGEKSNNIYYVIGRTPYITADGMLITEVDAFEGGINHPIMLRFVFDTNGPYKGPNRLGHDIFIYDSHPFGGQYYDMCDTIKALTYAQWGCYSYARKNISPIDNKKTYWDILYKPRSYWGQ